MGAKKEKASFEITELDQYLFGEGTHYEIYKKLGAHSVVKDGISGVYFAVWAPHAKQVFLIGSFNEWDETSHKMLREKPLGIFTLFVAEATVGEMYKYLIHTEHGKTLYKADPFANAAEMRPGTASVVADIESFRWGDASWAKKREQFKAEEAPISIYEVHPGSWKKHFVEGDVDGFYNYKELAHDLTDYAKEMGYTHIELMGIAEHPFDGSWGYQVTGYFAPTSRYGTPADFMYFVNYLHKNKIGVILDWVPAHFPKDAHGLGDFDGSALYEYADPRKGEHPDWGTKIFDYGKSEVKNFLISNALFWIEKYHIDGLRVDAVASMLYLDYGKQPGQWIPNKNGENKNLEAIEFFKHLNTVVTGRNHGVMMIAEESTAWPKVTGRAEENGLSFDLKWNMGWMNDFIEYLKLDPYFKKPNHHKMTFALSYAYSEKYVLVLSHDEVVHLKGSMINKMPGTYEEKFENLKTAYTFMYGHPGKKLLFMGQEFGQWQEWSENRQLDWFLLSEERHVKLKNYVRALNLLYQKYPAFYEQDAKQDGFEWINCQDSDRSIFSFIRFSVTGRNNLLFVCNFTPVYREDYRVGVPKKKNYQLLLDSNDVAFGGNVVLETTVFKAEKQECDKRPYSFAFPLAPLSSAVFLF